MVLQRPVELARVIGNVTWTSRRMPEVSHRSFADTINVDSSAISTGTLDRSGDSFSLNSESLSVDTGSGPFIFQTGDFYVDDSYIPD